MDTRCTEKAAAATDGIQSQQQEHTQRELRRRFHIQNDGHMERILEVNFVKRNEGDTTIKVHKHISYLQRNYNGMAEEIFYVLLQNLHLLRV